MGHREMRDLYNSTSFSAYVDYVLDSPNCYEVISDKCNEHIRPFNHKCNYCGIEFDVIGHMEDYEEDMLYISTKLNLIPLLQNITQVQNETPGKKASSAKRIKDYMSLLSPEQRQKLYYFYKIDFEMFEYDHEFV